MKSKPKRPSKHRRALVIETYLDEQGGWAALRNVVDKYPELLDRSIDQELQGIREACQERDQGSLAAIVAQRQAFLTCCRDVGVERAYLTYCLDPGADAPSELRKQLQSLLAKRDEVFDSERLGLYQKSLTLLDRDRHSYLWGVLYHELGGCLAESDYQEEAIVAYRRALEVRSPTETPVEWADSQSGLAAVYLRRGLSKRTENWEHALAVYNAARTELLKQRSPIRWGKLCQLLAEVHIERASERPEGNIEQAIALLQQALQVHSEQREPDQWAAIQLSLGRAYAARIAKDPDEWFKANDAANEAATVFTPTHAPLEYTKTVRLLGALCAYAEQTEGEPLDAETDSVGFLQEALRCLHELGDEVEFSSTLNQLAGMYLDRVIGDTEENIEEAIRLYREVAERSGFMEKCPHEWAKSAYGLARSYQDRPRGDSAENQERAVVCARQAVEVFAQQGLDVSAARAKFLLSQLLAHGNQAGNASIQEECIRLNEQVLAALGLGDDRNSWVGASLYLATLYGDRKEGDRAENHERGIRTLEQALAAFPSEAQSLGRTILTSRLATAYLERVAGNASDNIERTLALLDQVAEINTRDDAPDAWANDQHTRARSLAVRVVGDRQENRVLAIAACRNALAILTPEERPVKRAAVLQLMALGHITLSEWDGAAHTESAIVALMEACKLCEELNDPSGLAENSGFLANAYLVRDEGDRSENIEEAIRLLNEVLRIGESTNAPRVDMARTAVELAEVCLLRHLGDAEENLGDAITLRGYAADIFREQQLFVEAAECNVALAKILADYPLLRNRSKEEVAVGLLEEALKVLTIEHTAEAWALATTTLADMYARGLVGDQDEGRERAIFLFQSTLVVYTRQDKPAEWARLHTQLGRLYRQRGNPAENDEYSISLFNLALEVATEEDIPLYWAWTLHELGLTFLHRRAGDPADNVQRAIDCWLQASRVLSLDIDPSRYRDLAIHLGSSYVEQKKMDEAAHWFSKAMQALDSQYQQTLLLTERAAAGSESMHRYQLIAKGLVLAGRLREAAAVLETGRARGLGEALRREQAELAQIAVAAPDAHSQYLRATLWLRQLENSERHIFAHYTWLQQRASLDAVRSQTLRARADLAAAVQRIRAIPGQQDFLMEPRWQDCAASVSAVAEGLWDTELPPPVVYLVPIERGCLALLLRPAWAPEDVEPEALWLNEFPATDLPDLMFQETNNGEVYGYLPGLFGDAAELDAVLKTLLPALGERLIAPLAEWLRGEFDSVTLIPCNAFGLLPLHATLYMADGQQRAFLDEFTVSYTPSARTLVRARVAAQGKGKSPILGGVANPLPHSRPLAYARDELESLALHFAPESRHLLYEHEATKEAVLAMLPRASHVHLSCHGNFNAADPLASSFDLANAESLTLHELLAQEPLDAARLVVLSACQTALQDFFNIDEATGWPAAFLRLGVPGVVGTLWPAEAGATALFMVKFYELLQKGDARRQQGPLCPAKALNRAQCWLRGLTGEEVALLLPGSQDRLGPEPSAAPLHPFAAPRYWAPFVLVGV